MNEKFKMFLAIISGLIFLCGCGSRNAVYLETEQVEETEAAKEVVPPAESEQPEVCYVYVCGAVASPGVYELQAGSRVYEAIKSAGGLAEDADLSSINQAEHVTDGQMIKILTVSETENGTEDGNETASDGLLDINNASVADFMTLPGIGQSKAQSIVLYREQNGAFSSVDEIMNVDGIKEGVFNKIKDCIKV